MILSQARLAPLGLLEASGLRVLPVLLGRWAPRVLPVSQALWVLLVLPVSQAQLALLAVSALLASMELPV